MEITPYYQKDIECLNCRQKFKTTKVRSKFIKVVSHHTDFQPIYENKEVNPLLYNVFVCEHCGFSFTDDFTKYFAPRVKEIIQEQISSKWTPRSFGKERTIEEGIMAYKLAILSGTLKKEKFVSMAGFALRTAWLFRLQDKQQEENRFMEIARNRYADSYLHGDFNGTQMSESRILYLIAELSRKIGDIEYATRYFSKVIEKQNSSLEPTIIEMAKDRWFEIRAQKEKEAL